MSEGSRGKKTVALTIGLAGVAALLLTAILLLGQPFRGPSQDAVRAGTAEDAKTGAAGESSGLRIVGEEEALRQDARWYARDMGISLDEAVRRLKMQNDTLPSDLERELKETESDTFAGLWLRDKPTYGITVATAGDPEAMKRKIEPFVAGTQWEGTVNVERVGASEAELNANRAEAERMLDRLRLRYSSGDNIMKNRMEIYVRNKPLVERRLRAADLELPEHVVFIEEVAVPT